MTVAGRASGAGVITSSAPDLRGVAPAKGGRLRHLIRRRISEYPLVYLPVVRRKYPGATHPLFGTATYPATNPEVVSSQTQIVIDGYTRSATTFAVYAFQLAQERPVRMAHHLHAPAQLVRGARMGIPVLALIRDPEEVILSQLVREPRLSIHGALVAYARFYTCLLRYRSQLVVGDFAEVTRDFGSVVHRLNQRFGTSFVEFEHTEDNVRECLHLVKERATPNLEWSTVLGRFESGLIDQAELHRAEDVFARGPESQNAKAIWLPSIERSELKDRLRRQWFDRSLERPRARAESVYRAFVGNRPTG